MVPSALGGYFLPAVVMANRRVGHDSSGSRRWLQVAMSQGQWPWWSKQEAWAFLPVPGIACASLLGSLLLVAACCCALPPSLRVLDQAPCCG